MSTFLLLILTQTNRRQKHMYPTVLKKKKKKNFTSLCGVTDAANWTGQTASTSNSHACFVHLLFFFSSFQSNQLLVFAYIREPVICHRRHKQAVYTLYTALSPLKRWWHTTGQLAILPWHFTLFCPTDCRSWIQPLNSKWNQQGVLKQNPWFEVLSWALLPVGQNMLSEAYSSFEGV